MGGLVQHSSALAILVADLVGEYSVLMLNSSVTSLRNDGCVFGEASVAFLLVDAFVLRGLVCFEGDAMANEIFVFLCAVSVAIIPAKRFRHAKHFGDLSVFSRNSYCFTI